MFSDLVEAARESGNYEPVWQAFLASPWAVLVEPRDGKPNFRFEVREFGPERQPTIFVAAQVEQLAFGDAPHGISALGSAIVGMLQPEVAMAVVLGNGEVLGIPAGMVQHLRESAAA